MKKIAILGGGITGLAAAVTLAQSKQNVEFTLFESSDRLGGVLETIYDSGYLIERGADNFATLIPDARELTVQAGLGEQLIHPNQQGRQALVYLHGKIHPIPAGFSLMQPTRIGSILTTATLSWKAKLRLLQELWVAPRAEDVADESLESFATRRLGREAFENLVEPIVSGIFTADPKSLSMAATMPQFLEMERRNGGLIRGHLAAKRNDSAAAARKASGARYDQFMAPRNGMNSWLEGLANQLPADVVQLGTRITELQSARDLQLNRRWSVSTAAGQKMDFDAVICALPAAATAQLLKKSLPDVATLVGDIPYASSAVVAMIVNKSDIAARLDAFGLVVPSREQRQALAISFTSNKYPGRTPDSEILLRVFLGGATRPEVVDFNDEELYTMAFREVREILHWSGTQANWQGVIRWKNAMPQYLVGHVERMAQLDSLLAKTPGLKLCGAAYAGVGIPQCVRGAKKAVRELLEQTSTNQPEA